MGVELNLATQSDVYTQYSRRLTNASLWGMGVENYSGEGGVAVSVSSVVQSPGSSGCPRSRILVMNLDGIMVL